MSEMPAYALASMLATDLNMPVTIEAAGNILNMVKQAYTQGLMTGVAAERQACIDICKSQNQSGEKWWDNACDVLAETIEKRSGSAISNQETQAPMVQSEPEPDKPLTQQTNIVSFKPKR